MCAAAPVRDPGSHRLLGGMRAQRVTRGGIPATSAFVAVALGLAACGAPASSDPSSPSSGRTKTLAANQRAAAPSCEGTWLKVSVPHPHPDKMMAGTTGSEDVVVTTSRRCTLRGWPAFSQVRQETGTTRPRFRESRYGRPETVLLLAGRSAVARVTVRLPERWAWGGGNLCAGYVSAIISLPHLSKGDFVFDASPVFPLCGMPAGTLVHVSAWPFRPNTGAGSEP
jgi:hypothetical protein